MLPNKCNIWGTLLPPLGWLGGRRSAGWIAKQLKRQGCQIHKASWDDEWEIFAGDLELTFLKQGDEVLLSGSIADFERSLDLLRSWFEKVGVEYTLELYDENDKLLSEVTGPK